MTIRLEPRVTVSRWLSPSLTIGAVVVALVIAEAIIAAVGGDPVASFAHILNASFGSVGVLSDTLVKVILVATVGGAMVIIWRRWHDGVFLAMAVIVEASVFVISAFVVDRDRPPVKHLDPAAPSGSFPSGHTGAAVAFYTGVLIVVLWHTRNRLWRWVFGVIGVMVPLIVGTSRVYRGMHHPIDVVAGILLGLAALFVVRAALNAGVEEIDRDADDSVPARLR